jgi:hypothetical protein
VLLSQGYDVTLYDLQGNESQRDQVFGSSLRRASIDGLIAASIELTPDEIRALRASASPSSASAAIEGATAVDVDNARMATLATEHLLSLGHTGSPGAGRTIASAFQLGDARYDGWLSAMRAAGLEVEETGFWEADFDIPSGYAAAKALLAHDRPTAICRERRDRDRLHASAARPGPARPRRPVDRRHRRPQAVGILRADHAGPGSAYQGRLAAHLLLAQLDNPGAAPSTARSPRGSWCARRPLAGRRRSRNRVSPPLVTHCLYG